MWIHPAGFLFVGALLVFFLRGSARKVVLLLLPALALLRIFTMSQGAYGWFSFAGQPLLFGRVDELSRVFAFIFTIISFIGMTYALRVEKAAEHAAALCYAGAALGAVFAGDLIGFFLFWEIMAFASACLVWQGGERAKEAGFRYLMVHIAGGVCLLAGIVLHLAEGNSLAFLSMSKQDGLGKWLILLGILVNAAAPPLHAWLSDAYPEASVTGTVFLSAFTTKTAVYALARGFAGTEMLVWLGTFMTLYGVLYAMLENNTRRLLSYHIVSQVGFMVAGVGIGTPLAVNGAVAHAFAHILYKALLMMGMGSVLFMTGREKGTELGGLGKTMPRTCLLYMIGGFSISGVPFFSGFISKSMTLSAAGEAHRPALFLLLTLASCGTFLSTTLKLPYAVFWGDDKGIPASDPPGNMQLGMGLAALLCILMGLFPALLYRILPYPVSYHPYTGEHLVASLQLLLATALGFFLFLGKLAPHATVSLDFDRLYRRIGGLLLALAHRPVAVYEEMVTTVGDRFIVPIVRWGMMRLRKFDVVVVDGIVNGVGQTVFGGGGLSNAFEKYVVYGFINALGLANHLGARMLRRLQTGSVHNYAMVMVAGIFILVNVYLLLKRYLPTLHLTAR